ncbi:speckle-type POZ protein-like [Planococcus citri]|uniref:speckle-type POZ protein-like n=1 Tax=Planococcus citri TaxID=170843 RepID=UPI0031F801A2
MSDSQHIGTFFATIDKVKACNLSWTVPLYDEDDEDDGLPLISPSFSPENDSIKWETSFWQATRNGCRPELGLYCDSEDEIKTRGPVSGEFTLSILNAEGAKVDIHQQHFILQTDAGLDFENVGEVFELLILTADGKPMDNLSLPPDGNLTIICMVNYFYHKDIDINHQRSLYSFEALHSPLDCYEKSFLNPKFSDVTICINGKEYPSHKVILSSRSKVFEAMFQHDLQENQTSRIQVNDINEVVFLEILRFIYTGKVENLDSLASELLPVADRYDLRKLKIICENALIGKLSAKTAASILILADMCDAKDLKNQTVEFIKSHSEDVVKNTNLDHKKELISRPYLLKNLSKHIRSLLEVEK